MNKKVQSLVLAGMIVSANTLSVEGMEHVIKTDLLKQNQVIEVSSNQEVSGKQIYLSDISWMGASAGWGEVRKDSNVEGNGAIKLIIEIIKYCINPPKTY